MPESAKNNSSRSLVLLCSANRKAPHPAPAVELYRSEFFRLGRSYAWTFEPEELFILSAEHGLVPAEQELLPYPMTMSALGQEGDLHAWGQLIATQLRQRLQPERYRLVILGLRRFVAPLLREFPNAETPLLGMTMPQALNFLRSIQ